MHAIQKPGRVQMLPIESIGPSPFQARTTFDDTEIAALAVSILQNGLLQPISVRRTGFKNYQLVAGERRLRACRLAKLQRVPALVMEFEDDEAAALGLLENLQRTQLDPFDTARGIREVIRLWSCTQAEAARRLGLSQPALANKLRLLSLSTEQEELCVAHHLTERHARAALRLPENRRTTALKEMARDNLSVREADHLVESMLVEERNHTALPQPPVAVPESVRRATPMVRDVRFFVNSLQHAVDVMTRKGISATTTCGRREGFLEYTVRIPLEAEDTVSGMAMRDRVQAELPLAMDGFAAGVAEQDFACGTGHRASCGVEANAPHAPLAQPVSAQTHPALRLRPVTHSAAEPNTAAGAAAAETVCAVPTDSVGDGTRG